MDDLCCVPYFFGTCAAESLSWLFADSSVLPATDDTFAAVTGTGCWAGLVTIAGCVSGRVSFPFPAELYIVPAGILGHAAPGIGGWNLGHVAGPGPILGRKGEVYNCGREPLFCTPLCVPELPSGIFVVSFNVSRFVDTGALTLGNGEGRNLRFGKFPNGLAHGLGPHGICM